MMNQQAYVISLKAWHIVRRDGTILVYSDASIQRLQERIKARAGGGKGPEGGAA